MPVTSSDPIAHAEPARINVRMDELIALRQRVTHAAARRLIHASARTGERTTRRRGQGMDYLESRAYQAGDDVRHLDWRLTARSGSLHTKVFEEEGEHQVMLLVDTHASMHFGTRACFKSVQAARAAALMAWQVARIGGHVGALAFGDCRKVQPATAGQRGALGVCGALARWDEAAHETGSGEALSSALKRMRPLLGHPGHVVLVSDGHSCDASASSVLAHWRRRMRVSVLVVTDPLESACPPAGRYPLVCADRRVTVDLDSMRAREDFRRIMGAGARRLEEACRQAALTCRHIDTRDDPLAATTALLGLARRRTR
ncbi:MAG TPA: DUF58 domain-containing protein [Rhodanobacteraceae bacterium]|nr:DUF58 domain-containing protein [Rhodanobacteraceae bacterium]